MPVGLAPAPLMDQLPTSEPDSVYLNTLSVLVPSSTIHKDVPSVTRPLGLVSALFRPKLLAALWLPLMRLAAPVYLKTLSLLVLLATIQISEPLVAMPSTVALEARLPAVHEPSRPPLVS